MSPIDVLELLFFSIFGQATEDSLRVKKSNQPDWTIYLFKLVFGIYKLVSVVVLINLLIAMMTDTYQRIQAQSDIEWKYGLAKLIRNVNRTTTTPSPLNLVTAWFMYLLQLCKSKMARKKRPSMAKMMGLQSTSQMSARTKMGAKWLAKVKKGGQVAPKHSQALSIVHLSPLGSQLSFSNAATRIENIADWEAITKKYRAIKGQATDSGSESIDSDQTIGSSETTLSAQSEIFEKEKERKEKRAGLGCTAGGPKTAALDEWTIAIAKALNPQLQSHGERRGVKSATLHSMMSQLGQTVNEMEKRSSARSIGNYSINSYIIALTDSVIRPRSKRHIHPSSL